MFYRSAIRSPGEIVERNLKEVRNADRNLQLWFPRHQLVVLVCLLRDVAVDGSLALRKMDTWGNICRVKPQEQSAQEIQNRQGKSALERSVSAFFGDRFLCIIFVRLFCSGLFLLTFLKIEKNLRICNIPSFSAVLK